MQFDEIEQKQLKTWLINTINKNPSDANPNKLSDYIIALLKRNKLDNDFKKTCNDALNVFFQGETKNFVNLLFENVQNKKYLEQEIINESNNLDAQKSPNVNRNKSSSSSSSLQKQLTTSSSSKKQTNKYEKSSSKHHHSHRSRSGRNGRSFSESESSDSKSRSRSRSRSKSLDSNNNKNNEEEEDEEDENEDNKLIGAPTIEESTSRGWRRDMKRNNNYSKQHQYDLLTKSSKNTGLLNQNMNYDQYNQSTTTLQPIYVLPSRQSQIPIHPGGEPILTTPMGIIGNPPYYSQQQAQLAQQRNANANMLRQVNRPRSLVNIVTHEDDKQQQQQHQQLSQQQQQPKQKFHSNGKGIKRSYTHDNQPINNLMDTQTQFYQPIQQHKQQINIPSKISSTETSLIIRKVPKELNTEEKMREHFQQFGKIVDIINNYDNLQDVALVQFSTHQEALAAYKCPQPVFNNRFIRLHWLNTQHQQQQQQQHQQQKRTVSQNLPNDEPSIKKHVKERLDFNTIQQQQLYNEQNNKENKSIVVSPTSSLTKTVFNTDTITPPPPPTTTIDQQQKTPTAGNTTTTTTITTTVVNTKLVNNTTESPKSTIKSQQEERKALILELNEKRQKLIEEQIKQQKTLLQKIEQVKTAEEKNSILNMIKKISELIEQEKQMIVKQSSEFLSTTEGRKRKLMTGPPIKLPTKQQLKTNNIVNYPINTTLINATDTATVTNTSGTPAFLLTTPTSPIVATTKTFSHFRQINANVSVDHRPKGLLINDIENEEEKNLIISHVKGLSNIETVKNIDDKSVLIEFVTRKDAEVAFLKGSVYKNKQLNIKWHKTEKSKNINKESSEETALIESANNKDEIKTTTITPSSTIEATTTATTTTTSTTTTNTISNDQVIVSTNLNENEINELNSESDIDKLFDAQQSNDEELFEDENDDDEEESRPWRS